MTARRTNQHPGARLVSLASLLGIFLLSANASHGQGASVPGVPIGSPIAGLEFKDIRSVPRSLADLGKHKAYVFAFVTRDCPLVKKTLPKMKELYGQLQRDDVLFVCVNVGADDSIRDVASQALEYDVPFVFVKDYDLSVARALGVKRTPEFVVLDHSHHLRYRGRIDDQMRLGGTRPSPSRSDLQIALEEVLAGKSVSVEETTSEGCVITPPTAWKADKALTYYRDVASIVHDRCTSCHRPNTAAPFSLITAEDFAAHAEMIREVIRDQTMPPWYANSHVGAFQNDRSLTDAERRVLNAWLDSDRVAGEPSEGPALPEFSDSKWRIGTPDLVITMLEEHTVPATGFIPYKYVILPHVFFNETWVEAFEIRPENPAVVHHCNMAYATQQGASDETFITGYVPGGQPLDLGRFHAGIGYRIPAGAALGLQIHYTTTGKEEKSRIQVGLRFPREPVRKQLHHFVLDPRGWKIPPRDPAFKIRASHQLKHHADLLGLFTHMHVRGRDMTFFANVEDGQRECLLQIPNYNFEWQLGYELKSGSKLLPKGTTIEAIAHFDNSEFNPYNPDPTKTVEYGPQTVDEMFNGFVFYVDHDEQLNIQVNPKNGIRKK
ncbi:MAG: redoxin family protein [Planctomycetota bacterium]